MHIHKKIAYICGRNRTKFLSNTARKKPMLITLDLPPHIVETARKCAASEGISLDALVARAMEAWTTAQAHS
jgi:hypothetical protein